MIKNLTCGKIHKTSLFVQPESKCIVGCEGCYSNKAKAQSDYDKETFLNSILSILGDENTKFDQITLSLNHLGLSDTKHSCEVSSILESNQNLRDKGTELHVAMAINSLVMYEKELNFDSYDAVNISVDVAKITSVDGDHLDGILSLKEIYRKYPDIHFNWNLMLPRRMNIKEKSLLQTLLNKLEKNFDSIHLIIEKLSDPAGHNIFNEDSDEISTEIFESYLKTAVELKQRFGDKLFIDSCVQTTLDNAITGNMFACRAGVNHVSLWPDGKVTGCAYRTPDTAYNTSEYSAVKAADSKNIKSLDCDEWEGCVFRRLTYKYNDFESMCEGIGLDKEGVATLKGLV